MASLPPGADSEQLLVEANGSTRTLILIRPKQLNALSSSMIMGLLRCFTYEKDDGVKVLIMKGWAQDLRFTYSTFSKDEKKFFGRRCAVCSSHSRRLLVSRRR